MKRLMMLFVAMIATTSMFAQKSKMNSPNTNAIQIHVQNPCPAQTAMCPYCNNDASKKEQMKMDVMKIYTCSMHTQVVNNMKNNSAKCADCKPQLVVDRKGTKQPSMTSNCTMAADRNSVKTGKCPVCNMDLNTSKG